MNNGLMAGNQRANVHHVGRLWHKQNNSITRCQTCIGAESNLAGSDLSAGVLAQVEQVQIVQTLCKLEARLLSLMFSSQRPRTEWVKLIMSSLQQPFVSGVVDSSGSVMRVFYSFCCNIFRMDSKLATFEATFEA